MIHNKIKEIAMNSLKKKYKYSINQKRFDRRLNTIRQRKKIYSSYHVKVWDPHSHLKFQNNARTSLSPLHIWRSPSHYKSTFWGLATRERERNCNVNIKNVLFVKIRGRPTTRTCREKPYELCHRKITSHVRLSVLWFSLGLKSGKFTDFLHKK